MKVLIHFSGFLVNFDLVSFKSYLQPCNGYSLGMCKSLKMTNLLGSATSLLSAAASCFFYSFCILSAVSIILR
jgi:hypothetical protein